MLDGAGREAAWFRHEASRQLLVGISATGDFHVLRSMAPPAGGPADPPALRPEELVAPISWRCTRQQDGTEVGDRLVSFVLRPDGRVANNPSFEKWTLAGGRLYVVDRGRKQPLAFVRGSSPGQLVGRVFDGDSQGWGGAERPASYQCSSVP